MVIEPESINLHEFLTRWHGSPSASPGKPSVENDRLPVPLQEWYALSACWTSPIIKLKRMYSPDQIKRSGNKSIFMEDPDGDWFWAFDTEGMSAVFDSELYGEWELINESFSEFIVHNAVSETALGAPFWRESTQVHSDLLEEILAPMSVVSFGGWRWPRPGGRIFMSESMIAMVMPAMARSHPWGERLGYSEILVSAVEPKRLAYLDKIDSVKWVCYPRKL